MILLQGRQGSLLPTLGAVATCTQVTQRKASLSVIQTPRDQHMWEGSPEVGMNS